MAMNSGPKSRSAIGLLWARQQAAVATQALTSSTPDSNCTGLEYSGNEYWLCSNYRDWTTARAKCQAVGLELVRIDDEAENEFIEDQILTDRWIGGSDITQEGAWTWDIGAEQFWAGDEDSASVGGLYTNWKLGQPNNYFGQDR